jgi:CheY-like chemotaxis protein
VKFTPEGGRIDVRLHCHQNHAEFSVADSGIGIKPEFLPHVFDRFSQADGSTTRVHGGLGIGLAIVRHLVELHGGLVRVESTGEGEGTTFFVRIPAVTHSEAADKKPPTHAGQRDGVRMLACLHVLIVEDDADAREFLGEALSQWGASVTLAAAVDEALAAMDQRVPDILVSDIAMPGKDGYALIRAVRARSRRRGGRVPAVALTAYASARDRSRVIDEGFQMHVSKPIEPAELATVIARLTMIRAEEPPTATE